MSSDQRAFAIDFDHPSRPMLERFHEIQLETWQEIIDLQVTPSLQEAHRRFLDRLEAQWGPITQEQFESMVHAFVDMVIAQLGGQP